jgi:hypothetical protein
MDVSPDHEPTLIERGTDVHLNHLITAQRGTHDSRPARWESWTPHPPVPRKDDEGAYEQDGEHAPIASNGPSLGGSTHGCTSWICTEHRQVSIRAHGTAEAETSLMSAEPNTSHNDGRCGKTLKEYTHSSKASGARSAGPLARPHGIAQHPGGNNVPSASVSLCGFLTHTTIEARGLLSETSIRVP